MRATAILHWTAVLAFGALGGLLLYACGEVVWQTAVRNGWSWAALIGALMLPIPLLPSALGYFTFHRQYRGVIMVLVGFAAVMVWGELSSLVDALGLQEYFLRAPLHNPLAGLLGLPLALLSLIAPICGAVWFFKICMRLVDRALGLPKARRSESAPCSSARSEAGAQN